MIVVMEETEDARFKTHVLVHRAVPTVRRHTRLETPKITDSQLVMGAQMSVAVVVIGLITEHAVSATKPHQSLMQEPIPTR